jgi:hypothetical protein
LNETDWQRELTLLLSADSRWALLQKVIHIWAPKNETNFFNISASLSFSKRAKLLGVTVII